MLVLELLPLRRATTAAIDTTGAANYRRASGNSNSTVVRSLFCSSLSAPEAQRVFRGAFLRAFLRGNVVVTVALGVPNHCLGDYSRCRGVGSRRRRRGKNRAAR